MTALLRSWVLGLAWTAMFCAVVLLLTPKGRVRRVTDLLCGVIMAAALLSPLADPALEDYGLHLAEYRSNAAAVTGAAEEIAGELDRSVIEEKLAAYILDKAQQLGTPLAGAQVILEWRTEGLWVPTAAVLQGEHSPQLARLLESELGIPEEAQIWRTDENA